MEKQWRTHPSAIHYTHLPALRGEGKEHSNLTQPSRNSNHTRHTKSFNCLSPIIRRHAPCMCIQGTKRDQNQPTYSPAACKFVSINISLTLFPPSSPNAKTLPHRGLRVQIIPDSALQLARALAEQISQILQIVAGGNAKLAHHVFGDGFQIAIIIFGELVLGAAEVSVAGDGGCTFET